MFTQFCRSHSILVGRPQFGSRPNLYKTTSAAKHGHLGGRTRERSTLSSKYSVVMDQVDLEHWNMHQQTFFWLRCSQSHFSDRVQKMRKIVRPRLKIDSGARQARHVPKEREEEGQAADSTTESDEPGQSIKLLRGFQNLPSSWVHLIW